MQSMWLHQVRSVNKIHCAGLAHRDRHAHNSGYMIWLPQGWRRDQGLAGLPPALAGDVAYRLFCTPGLSERRHPNYDALAARARFHLRPAQWQRVTLPFAEIQLYTFEPQGAAKGTVLIVHGWTSEASFMTVIAEAVRRAGFRAVLIDLPAHGMSSGRITNLITCARAVLLIGERIGPLSTIITHSFGGMTALVAAEGRKPLERALAVPRIILLSSPNRIAEVTGAFARHWQMPAAAERAFIHRIERIGERSLADFSVARLLATCGCQATLLHARDDQVVPFSSAEDIANAVPGVALKAFDGLGHSAILFAPPVMRTIAADLKN